LTRNIVFGFLDAGLAAQHLVAPVPAHRIDGVEEILVADDVGADQIGLPSGVAERCGSRAIGVHLR
jgi:hypothetical protein